MNRRNPLVGPATILALQAMAHSLATRDEQRVIHREHQHGRKLFDLKSGRGRL